MPAVTRSVTSRRTDSIRARGTAGRHRGPRRGGQAHAHRPAARRPRRARRRARPSPSPATTPTCTPSWPATPCTDGWATSPTPCTRWRCCSRWTAAPPRDDLRAALAGARPRARRPLRRLQRRLRRGPAAPGRLRGVRRLGARRWRSSGSACPSPTGTCSWTCPAPSPPQRAAHRERTEPGPRPRPLRVRRRAAGPHRRRSTAELAAAGWLAPWTVLDGAADLGRTDPGYAALVRRPRSARSPRCRAFHELSVGGGILRA